MSEQQNDLTWATSDELIDELAGRCSTSVFLCDFERRSSSPLPKDWCACRASVTVRGNVVAAAGLMGLGDRAIGRMLENYLDMDTPDDLDDEQET